MSRERDAAPPWGRWEVLDEGLGYKVKRIEVEPGQRLSYQLHHQRGEHWYVVSGQALVILDGVEHALSAGQAIDIATNAAHRIANPGSEPLLLIEVQRGDYLGEDDIVRLEDDYGRNG